MALVNHVPGRFIENFHGNALSLKFSHDLKWFSGVYSPHLAHKPHVRPPVVSTGGHVMVQEDAPDAKLLNVSDANLRRRHNPELLRKAGGGLLRKSRLIGTIKHHRTPGGDCVIGNQLAERRGDAVHSPLHVGSLEAGAVAGAGAGAGPRARTGSSSEANAHVEIAGSALRQIEVGGDGIATPGFGAELGEAGATGITLVGRWIHTDLNYQGTFEMNLNLTHGSGWWADDDAPNERSPWTWSADSNTDWFFAFIHSNLMVRFSVLSAWLFLGMTSVTLLGKVIVLSKLDMLRLTSYPTLP